MIKFLILFACFWAAATSRSSLARNDLCGRFPGSCKGFIIGGSPNIWNPDSSPAIPANPPNIWNPSSSNPDNLPPKYVKPQSMPSVPAASSRPYIPSAQSKPSVPSSLSSPLSNPINPNAPLSGIPSGGMNGPLTGLGGSPAVAPQFGGPVQGGLGVGQSLYSPYFGANSGTNIVPTQGVMSGSQYNVAGMGVGAINSVNFGGLPGLGLLNNQLGIPANSLGGMGGGLGSMGGLGNMGGVGGLGSMSGFGRKKRWIFHQKSSMT